MKSDKVIERRSAQVCGHSSTRPLDNLIASLPGRRVLVLGMGRAGTAAARFLLRKGALVFGYDSEPAKTSGPAAKKLESAGMRFVADWKMVGPDFAVASPGLSEDNKVVVALRKGGVPVVDELDLAARFLDGPLVAATGTNGKSTTTALIGRMLKDAGKRVFVGGNLAPGKPLSAALLAPRKDYYVAEVSSFQLERARWIAPRVAVLLNITADHLNRHRSIRRYAECKYRLFDRQTESDFAVLNRDDRLVMAASRRGRARRLYFSLERRVEGAYLSRGWIWQKAEGRRWKAVRVAPVAEMKLKGRHNIANALAAVACGMALGLGRAAMRRTLRRFGGLPHRLEPVRVIDGVEYVNNSMCTNPTAGIRSLEAFPSRVALITGGREKGLPVADYIRSIAARAKYAVLYGENADRLARLLCRADFRRCEVAERLREAVLAAKAHAGPGDTVLFSPAFASFDRFRDFQARGRAFKREVDRLA